MTLVPEAPLMTADDLLNLPDDGNRYELVDGRLIRVSLSSTRPAVVASKIGAEVRNFVKQHKLGMWGGADWGFRLRSNPDLVRGPDGAFVSAARIPAEGIPAGFWHGAPDLALEVISPSDRMPEVLRKVREYLDAGARLVWVVDPEAREAMVFRPGGGWTSLDENGVLDGEDVLPGFTLPLRDVLL